MKTFFVAMTLLILGVTSGSAESYVAGTHYQILQPPMQTSSLGRIEVRYFFWYGDGNSFQMESALKDWAKRQPNDVFLERTPAVWTQLMGTHASAFYALKTIGASGIANDTLLREITTSGKKLASERDLQTVLTPLGISAQNFSRAFNSFATNKQVRQAENLTRAARLSGLPTFVVGGKYKVDRRTGGSQREQLQIVDFLLQKERLSHR